MLLRDRQDRERSVAPLRQAHDAIVIDSTDKTISQVVDIMMGIIENIWHNH
jgi:cytidylate kinase